MQHNSRFGFRDLDSRILRKIMPWVRIHLSKTQIYLFRTENTSKGYEKECPAKSPILSGFFAPQKPFFGASKRQKKNPSLFLIWNKLGFFRDRRKENAARHATHLHHPRGQGRACPGNAAKNPWARRLQHDSEHIYAH